ncbi:MAG: hypothetical protein FJZ95_00950 [Chloroflexi bacterium]|nr:hypothetical protein [Chloroflexota bacterium]
MAAATALMGVRAMSTAVATRITTIPRTADCCDLEGYLKDPSQWNWDLAQAMAIDERLGELTNMHRRVIEYVREYYEVHRDWPLPARIAKDVGFKRCDLFRSDPEILFKVAGLPNPHGHIVWDVRNLYHHRA